jgi:glycosyltransferase involved in cell wall biosynthesis
LTLTVVIPALNEAARLPALLRQLGEQTRPPDEVILADAGSSDATRETARRFGVLVTEGGRPAAGRNEGADAAAGDLILFLDADVDIDPDFIETSLAEFEKRKLTVATAHIEPLEHDVENLFACEVVNLYLDLMQRVVPHAPGFCILVRRDTHEAIGGFDETVILAEDHDYVRRAAKLGKFRVLRGKPVRTSMRRIEKEGLVKLAFKYLYCELYVISGRKIHDTPFEYEFAAFDTEGDERTKLHALRDILGDVTGPVRTLSAEALDTLVELGQTDVSLDTARRMIARVSPHDFATLRRYVKIRARLARLKPTAVLRRVRRAGDRAWSELTRW